MTAILKLATKAARRFYYDAFLAPKGYGRPVPKATWDSQYQEGAWDHLFSLDELAHYMVIVGYARHLFKAPKILDVGCGPGRLLELLTSLQFESYVGIDLSSEAIDKARSLGISNATFQVADFEEWTPKEEFNTVIFNESLCYARRPVDAVLRYTDLLKREGAAIVSLCRFGNHGIIWKNLEAQFSMVDSTTVENSKAQMWDIRVLQRK
jgi:2-polyprenyl-3-methyl-5-hydroxy-6-metoxy-1,4-benzoquinol methylase